MAWSEAQYKKALAGQAIKPKLGRKPKIDPVKAEPMRFTLVLPFPPSANRYWRNYHGVTVVSDEARRYKQCAGELARRGGANVGKARLAVWLVFYFERLGGDLDNRIKVCLDALQGICFDDDKQIDEIHAVRRLDRDNPRVEMVIQTI